MKKFASLLTLVLAFSVVSFVGCSGPPSAGEDEALQGMDDMGEFDGAAELTDDEMGGDDTDSDTDSDSDDDG
jgi:hypothetical protein